MAKTSQLTEIQDEASMGKEKLPMKRCMGLNCNEKVPHGEYFCPACAKKKDSVRRVKSATNGSDSHRVIRGIVSSREV